MPAPTMLPTISAAHALRPSRRGCAVALLIAFTIWGTRGPAIAIVLAGVAGLAFWVLAMWTRPAFVTVAGQSLLLSHGRPGRFLGLPLARRRRVLGGADAIDAAQRRGLIDRPMNAHVLDSLVNEMLAEAEQPTP